LDLVKKLQSEYLQLEEIPQQNVDLVQFAIVLGYFLTETKQHQDTLSSLRIAESLQSFLMTQVILLLHRGIILWKHRIGIRVGQQAV